MWTASFQVVDPQTTRFTLHDATTVLSFREVIELWCEGEAFREFFNAVLGNSAFEAFFWELPPVTSRTLDHPFECVLVQAPSLSRLLPDPTPFGSHFIAEPPTEVLTFPNLGGDALLVVPAPVADHACYPHLARFVRSAPCSQVQAFWRNVGLAMRQQVSSRPTWLSTAGLGVSWLHLRLDSRPKYYRHGPYKQEPR